MAFKQQHFLSISLFLCPIIVSAQEVSLRGLVRDSISKEPLIGTLISTENGRIGANTNAQGYYSLTLPSGQHRLTISHVGYQPQVQLVDLKGNQQLNVDLQPATNRIDEVQVAQKPLRDHVSDTQIGAVHLDMQEIKDVPVLLGEKDVLKTIQLLPGVHSGGEGSSHFNVRGGDGGQNLILLDQATVYNASHLLGFFSTFNSDAIKDIQLYKGGIPAQFGGRIASVLDISMLEGNKKQFSGEGGIGLIASRLKLEGPIERDKSSFMFSARRSYADSFLKLAKDKDISNNTLYFYDLNAKFHFQLSEKTNLYVSGYHGKDKLDYTDLFHIGWGNSTGTARLSHHFNHEITSNTAVVYSGFNYNAGVSSDQTDFQVSSKIRNLDLKQDFTYRPNVNNSFRIGANMLLQEIRPANLSSEKNQSVNPTSIQRQRGIDLGGYVSHEWKPLSYLSLNYGIHLHDFMVLGQRTFYGFNSSGAAVSEKRDNSRIAKHYINIEPRFSASLLLNEQSSLKASFNRIVQNLHQLTNTTSSLPTDQYVLSSLNIKPQVVDQASLGYFRDFDQKNYAFSVEAYYKRLGNQIDMRNGATLQANEHFEGELLFGRGRAYGLEWYLRKKKGKLTGWVSYTLSKSQRQFAGINNGSWFNARQDQTHDLSIVALYNLSQSWTLGATFAFNTGNAVTFPSGKYMVNGKSIFYYTERNGYRMPDYHRLDFSATYDPKPSNKRFHSSWTFGVYNAYNRKNAYTIDFREDKSNPNRTEAYKVVLFGIIPSVTWNFKF